MGNASMMGGMLGVAQFIPLFLLSIPLAIGCYFLAARMGRNRALWIVLALIPIVNFIFIYYVMFAVMLYVLDRLNELTNRTARTA